jgi:hypothetical protein
MIVGPMTSLIEFRKKVCGKFSWLGVTTSHNLPENPAVCERGADSPEGDRSMQLATLPGYQELRNMVPTQNGPEFEAAVRKWLDVVLEPGLVRVENDHLSW